MGKGRLRRGGRSFGPFNPFQRSGNLPAYGSYDHGYVTGGGTGLAQFVTSSIVRAILTASALGLFVAVGASSAAALPVDFSASGSSSVTFAGAANAGGAIGPGDTAAVMLSASESNFLVVCSTNVQGAGALSGLGAGAASIVPGSRVAVPFSSAGAGAGTFTASALTPSQANLSSTAAGAATLIGASVKAAGWSATGQATTTLVGLASSSGFTEVGGGSQRASKAVFATVSTTLAYPGNVVSGNLLVCGGAAYNGLANPDPVVVSSDRTTGNWTVVKWADGANELLWIAYAVATSSGACTVTVDPTEVATGASFSFSIDEFSGQHATPLSVDGGNSTGTSTTPADSITTATANELILGCMLQDGSTTTLTPGGSYTQIGESEDNNTGQCHSLVFRIATTATAYSVDWTIGSSEAWRAMTVSFKAA